MRSIIVALAWAWATVSCLALGDRPCDPEMYGEQCAGGGQISLCSTRSCEDNPFPDCEERHFIDERPCPSHRPRCEDVEDAEPPEVVCLGEVGEPCEMTGFVACLDEETVLECLHDAEGELVLSQGSCDPTEACHPPFEFHAGGCTGLVPPP